MDMTLQVSESVAPALATVLMIAALPDGRTANSVAAQVAQNVLVLFDMVL